MLNNEILTHAIKTIEICKKADWKLSTVESCTGGLITAYLTSVSGSSDVVDRGFTTYSNEAKNELVGVPLETIKRYGAVSEQVAQAMAEGGLKNSVSDIAISVTGIAGPGGGTTEKPVGLVHFGCATRLKDTLTFHEIFEGDREEVRSKTVLMALKLVQKALI
ncbi:MAG: damage-inducible protein CinA [Rhodospirillales bacterium]|nr:damage-inducible protein CinA [Rhodospirillales bacterium]